MSSKQEIKICHSTRTILQYSLIWPPHGQELHPGKMYYIRVLILILLSSGWCCGILMHLIATLKYDSDLFISEDIAFVVASCGLYYATFVYVKNQQKLVFLLVDLSNFNDFGIPPNFEENNKRLNVISHLVHGYSVLATTIYNCVKFWERNECEEFNKRIHFNQVCGALAPFWSPVDVRSYPYLYYFYLIYVFICTQVFIKMSLMISFQCTELVHHIIFRINHLNAMIRKCFDDKDYQIRRTNLRQCILYHLKILEFASRLDECFSTGMFAHITITSVIVGCIEKQFVEESHKVCATLHMGGWILSLFLACFGGQKLINSSESIPEALWSSKWYKSEVSLVRDLHFILMRSQKNFKITAGPFGVMSYAVFVSVIHTYSQNLL